MRDSDEMPFGKYRGEKLGDVPASYLLWVAEQEGMSQRHPGLIKYIENNLTALVKEAKELQ